MQHTRDFNNALRWLAAGRLAAQAVSWVITVLVIRLLTPGDYGLAAMVATVMSLISLIAEFGFGTAIVQAREITKEQSASVFGASIVFGILSSTAVAFLAPLAAAFYGEPRLQSLIQVAAASFFISSLATLPDAQLRRALRFKALSFADFLSTFIGSLTTYGLALAGKGVWALVIGQLCVSAVRIIILHSIVTDRIWPNLKISKALELIRFGGQVAVARIAGYAVTQSDFLIAGKFLGKEALGHYSVALDLAMLPLSKIMNIVNQAALPALAKISREQIANQQQMLLSALRLMGYVIFPGLWGIAAISPWLISVLLGETWAVAVLPLQIICVVLPLRMISLLVSTASVSFGRADIELKDKLTSTFIFPIAFFVGAKFGVIGIASAWCIALPLTLGINLFRTRKVFGFSHFQVLAALRGPAIFSGLMAVVVYAMGQALGAHAYTWPAVMLMVVVGAVTYSLLLWFQDRSAAFSLLDVVSPSLRKRLQATSKQAESS